MELKSVGISQKSLMVWEIPYVFHGKPVKTGKKCTVKKNSKS